MKLKMNLIAAATVALFAATSAVANPVLGNAGSLGNSSVSFVAINGIADTSLTVDLGIDFASFVSAATGFKTTDGLLSGGANPGGVTATWNFNTNTFSVNNVAQAGSFAWTGAVSSFLGTAAGDYRWGVIGGDGVSGNLSATNVLFGQNILYTSVSNDFDVSNESGINGGAIASGAGNYNQFLAATTGRGTHSATARGANVATGGTEFLGTALAASGQGDFSQQFGTNSFLINPTDTAKFYISNSGAALPRTFALGSPNVLGAEADPFAATWVWDQAASTLTYSIPAAIPEPGTYALLLAGLAAVGFMARRRRGA